MSIKEKQLRLPLRSGMCYSREEARRDQATATWLTVLLLSSKVYFDPEYIPGVDFVVGRDT